MFDHSDHRQVANLAPRGVVTGGTGQLLNRRAACRPNPWGTARSTGSANLSARWWLASPDAAETTGRIAGNPGPRPPARRAQSSAFRPRPEALAAKVPNLIAWFWVFKILTTAAVSGRPLAGQPSSGGLVAVGLRVLPLLWAVPNRPALRGRSLLGPRPSRHRHLQDRVWSTQTHVLRRLIHRDDGVVDCGADGALSL